MQLAHKSFKLLITGRSGTGKTSYFHQFLSAADYEKIFIYDHQGEMQLRMQESIPSFTVEELNKSVESKSRFVIFDPSEMYPGESIAGFQFFCEYVYEISRLWEGKKLFAVDELQTLVDQYSMPWEFSLLLETGRRAGIDAVMISQQPNIIHNRIRNLLSEVVTFLHIDQNAIKFLEGLGFSEQEIRSLKILEFIAYNVETNAKTRGRLGRPGEAPAEVQETSTEKVETSHNQKPIDENNKVEVESES